MARLHTDGMADDLAPPSANTFDEVVLPHLEAGRRLARWIMGNHDDADDVVQEASLRAFRYFRTFTGGNGRAWFLRIVRNTCSGWYGQNARRQSDPFDEEQHSGSTQLPDPETRLLRCDELRVLEEAMQALPDTFHQVLALREIEGLSYRELADVMGVPIGTVMSRLSRARDALRAALHVQRPHPSDSPSCPDELHEEGIFQPAGRLQQVCSASATSAAQQTVMC